VPQAICSHYGLAIGAWTAWFVRFLMLATAGISWPISKLLDYLLGAEHTVCLASPVEPRGVISVLTTLHPLHTVLQITAWLLCMTTHAHIHWPFAHGQAGRLHSQFTAAIMAFRHSAAFLTAAMSSVTSLSHTNAGAVPAWSIEGPGGSAQ